MIRSLALSDALTYIAFRKLNPINQALISPINAGGRLGLVGTLGRSALPEPSRPSWVYIEKGSICGVVGVRHRLGTDIWDVDQLAAVSDDQSRILAELLNCLVSAAYSEGVQRIFLRVEADSEAEQAGRQVGFVRYTTESIYHLQRECKWPSSSTILRFRPRSRIDHQALFQLYSSAVPVRVRQIEGMTLQEWRSHDGWGLYWGLYPGQWRIGLPYGRRDYVAGEAGTIAAWLQVEPRASLVRILTRPTCPVDSGTVIAHIESQFHKKGGYLLAAREYQESLHEYLDQKGSSMVAKHALLSRSLAVRVAEPRLVPLRARAQ